MSNNKKILVIGGGPLQTPLIKKINEMGYISLCVDKDPNAEGFKFANIYSIIDVLDREECLNFALKNKIDAVLTVATDVAILTVAYIAEKMSLIGTPLQVIELIKNKYLVRKKLYENGISSGSQFFVIDNINDIEKLEDKINYPVIVKPCDGSGSRGVEKVEQKSNLKNAVENAIQASHSKRAYIESFFEGKEYGVESFVTNGNVNVLGIMKKYMTKPPIYAELGHSIPSGLDEEIEKKIITEVKKSIKALGIQNGSVNMDLILSNNGEPHIVDIGARMGGNLIGSHIIPYSKGIDILENLVKLSLGKQTDIIPKFNKNVSTRILNLKPGIVKEIKNIQDLIDGKEVLDIVLNTNIGKKVNEYKSNGDTCGWVVVSKATPEETEKFAIDIRNKVEQLIIIE